MDSSSLIVKPEAARKQLEAERQEAPGEAETAPEGRRAADGGPEMPEVPTEAAPPRRFHGVVTQNTLRVGRDAGDIAENIIQFLENLPEAEVSVTLEIQASIPEGVPDNIVRTVTENARTLKFDESSGFERD